MKLTNQSGVSLALAVWLANDSYDYNYDPTYISATTLLQPTKKVILSRQIQQSADVLDLVASRLGSAIHDSIELAWTDNYEDNLKKLGFDDSVIERVVINPERVLDSDIPIYLEQRSSKEIDGYVVSGKYDLVAEGMVQDFKSTSVYTLMKGTNDEKYIQQGSIYRWLNPDIITSNKMKIHFIFKDWSAAKAKFTKDYPPYPIVSKEYKLMSLVETERMIRSKISDIKRHENKLQDEMPYCTDEELWRSAPTYKYYTKPDNKRATSTHDTYAEAYTKVQQKGGVVKEVKSEVKACKYCPALDICKQAQDLIASGDLVL